MTANHIASTMNEKSKISAGIMARIGMNRAAIYRLLWQNSPSPRFGKSFRSPSRAIFLDTKFSPEVHRELSIL